MRLSVTAKYLKMLLHEINNQDKVLVCAETLVLNLNLNSLLVKRQIDNPSPGAVTGGKLVPSSHKRGELRYAII